MAAHDAQLKPQSRNTCSEHTDTVVLRQQPSTSATRNSVQTRTSVEYAPLTTTHLSHRRASGAQAESIAARFLQERGYRILQRNTYTPYGEIDLIAKKGETYICVEVRSRRSPTDLPPELSLTHTKYQHWIRSVLSIAWLHNKAVRLDCITVVNQVVAQHYKDVRVSQVQSRHKLAYAL